MLPSSHEVHIDTEAPLAPGLLLAEAFSQFISASGRLELSYRDLQAEVAELSVALSERNQALSASLSENKRVGLTLERIVDAMPCGVLVVSNEGAVRMANPEAVRLLSLPAHRMPSLDAIRSETGLDLRLDSPWESDQASEQELSVQGTAGRHWLAVRHVPLPTDEQSQATAEREVVLTLRDISKRKYMEGEREAARDAVALAQVSALLAHEIRNPLASMELFAGLLTDSPERSEEWLSHLRAGIRTLAGTVNNVLTLHGGTTVPMERVNLAQEVTSGVRFLQPLAQQANISLSLQVQEGELWIRANRSALHQMLLNLCSNALRHTQAGGTVRVVCHSAQQLPDSLSRAVRLSVEDSGSGIPREDLHRLFEGGFSGSGNTPGLGLAVCDRLMRQHGGAIHVESVVGAGSSFMLEFPQA